MRTIMNEKEEFKAAIIECCINGTMTIKEAAKRLHFSERYVKKLKARYKKFGASSMLHGNCGKQPKHTMSAEIKSRIIEIRKQEEFEECNIEHFREILEEFYDIHISYTTLYNLLLKNGIKSPRKHKKAKSHNRRKRRPCKGELLQADATPHPFFYGDPNEYSVHRIY